MMASLLHLVHQPIPVAGGFDGDVGGFGELPEEVHERFALVFDSLRWIGLAVLMESDEDGVTFVGVTAQYGFLHAGDRIALVSALSYDHPAWIQPDGCSSRTSTRASHGAPDQFGNSHGMAGCLQRISLMAGWPFGRMGNSSATARRKLFSPRQRRELIQPRTASTANLMTASASPKAIRWRIEPVGKGSELGG